MAPVSNGRHCRMTHIIYSEQPFKQLHDASTLVFVHLWEKLKLLTIYTIEWIDMKRIQSFAPWWAPACWESAY